MKDDISIKVIEMNETFDDEQMSSVLGGGTDGICILAACGCNVQGGNCECNSENAKVVTPGTDTGGTVDKPNPDVKP